MSLLRLKVKSNTKVLYNLRQLIKYVADKNYRYHRVKTQITCMGRQWRKPMDGWRAEVEVQGENKQVGRAGVHKHIDKKGLTHTEERYLCSQTIAEILLDTNKD